MAANSHFRRPYRWWVWLLLVGVWTVLLLIPIPESGPLRDIPSAWRQVIAKGTHVSAYAVMTLLAGWLQVPLRWRWLLIFFLMGHASVTELLQIPAGRGGSLYDVGWDHLGVLLGVLAGWKWWSAE